MGRARATAALALALGLAATAGAACSGDGGRSLSSAKKALTATTAPGNQSAFGACQPLPSQGTTPAWFPADLPLPDGSYAVGELAGAPPGFHKGAWAVKAAALVVGALAGACGSGRSSSPAGSPTTAASPDPAGLAWPAPSPDRVIGLAKGAGLVPETHESLEHHVHAHLDVYIDGQPR